MIKFQICGIILLKGDIFMNENIIKTYFEVIKLKNAIRTGWLEVGISADRIESVAEHVFGTQFLAMMMNSEFKLNLDMQKVYEMIMIREVSKINLNSEYTPNSKYDVNEAALKAKKTVIDVTSELSCSNHIASLIEEAQKLETKESKFVLNVSKLESDLQAKYYDLNGQFDLENALADVKNYGSSLTEEILPKVKNASDGWLNYDRRYYSEDETFLNLSNDIEKYQR